MAVDPAGNHLGLDSTQAVATRTISLLSECDADELAFEARLD
jgi:hypothetical protein